MQLLSVTSEVLQLLVGLDESTGDPTSLFAGTFADVETTSPQTLIDFLCQFSSVAFEPFDILWPSRSVRGSGHVEKRMATYCAVAGRPTCPRSQIARNDETISGRSNPCPLEHGPRNWAPISRKRSCENKDLRDAPKTKQIGTICLDRCSTSSLVFGADRF